MADVDFVTDSKRIVEALANMMINMSEEDERIRFVYGNAINDAINFVRDMGQSNPDIRLACMRLEREMKEWLPLRSEPVLK